jgi:hypothetical protein
MEITLKFSFRCTARTDAGSSFRPVCQKYKDDHLQSDDVGQNEPKHFPDERAADCLEPNVRFALPKADLLSTIDNVASADACKAQCAATPTCQVWVWRGSKPQRDCLLSKGVRKNGVFRRPLNGAFSGSVAGACATAPAPTAAPASSSSSAPITKTTEPACAEFNAVFTGLTKRQQTLSRDVPSADVCRAFCLQKNGCKLWSWRGADAKQPCALITVTGVNSVAFEKGAVSGSVEGACVGLAISQLTTCKCVAPGAVDAALDAAEDTDDLVGAGLIDVRLSAGSGEGLSAAEKECPEGQVLRCVAANATPNVRSRLAGEGQDEEAAGSGQ